MVNNGNHEGKGFLVYKCTCLALPIVETNTSYVFQGCVRASLFSHVQLFATSWTVVHQTLLSMGFPRQEYWNGLSFFFSRGSSRPRDQTQKLLPWQAYSLLLSCQGSPFILVIKGKLKAFIWQSDC